MKKIFLSLSIVALVYFLAPINTVHATANVCFCHTTPSDPFTNCTSNSGEQNGHTNHGDQPFGCECGDGICSPEHGEDCATCPADCTDDTDCSLCGDGIADEGEECNEPGLDCPSGACVGCRCLPLCGDGVVDFGEQCDDSSDPCCNADCTLSDAPECGGGGTAGGGTATASDGSDGGADGGTDGHCQFVPQTGGNGQGCSRDFEQQCGTALNEPSRDSSSLMLSFAFMFLPPIVLLPGFRSRRKKLS